MKPEDLKKLIKERIQVLLSEEEGPYRELVTHLDTLIENPPTTPVNDGSEIIAAAEILKGLISTEEG